MSYRVLLVDDDPHVLKGIRRPLIEAGFQVELAGDASEAMAKLGTVKIDAVVSDYNMPGLNGAQLMAKVYDLDPTTVRFLLTGNASLEVAVQAVNEGKIDRFLTKPCNAVELTKTLELSLQQRDLINKARQLVVTAKRQEKLIESLEGQHPGITQVDRHDDGAIVIEDIPDDPEALLAELNALLDEPLDDRLAG